MIVGFVMVGVGRFMVGLCVPSGVGIHATLVAVGLIVTTGGRVRMYVTLLSLVVVAFLLMPERFWLGFVFACVAAARWVFIVRCEGMSSSESDDESDVSEFAIGGCCCLDCCALALARCFCGLVVPGLIMVLAIYVGCAVGVVCVIWFVVCAFCVWCCVLFFSAW